MRLMMMGGINADFVNTSLIVSKVTLNPKP
jgi:hypothetical protein